MGNNIPKSDPLHPGGHDAGKAAAEAAAKNDARRIQEELRATGQREIERIMNDPRNRS